MSAEDGKSPLGSTKTWHPSRASYLLSWLDSVLDNSNLGRAEHKLFSKFPCPLCKRNKQVHDIETTLSFLTLLFRYNSNKFLHHDASLWDAGLLGLPCESRVLSLHYVTGSHSLGQSFHGALLFQVVLILFPIFPNSQLQDFSCEEIWKWIVTEIRCTVKVRADLESQSDHQQMEHSRGWGQAGSAP